jgi:hypothetical protein
LVFFTCLNCKALYQLLKVEASARQGLAAVRDVRPADDRLGSFATDTAGLTYQLMSASLPKATYIWRHCEMTLRAKRRHRDEVSSGVILSGRRCVPNPLDHGGRGYMAFNSKGPRSGRDKEQKKDDQSA